MFDTEPTAAKDKILRIGLAGLVVLSILAGPVGVAMADSDRISDEQPQVTAQAQSLSYGDTIESELDSGDPFSERYAGYHEVYTFEASEGDVISVEMRPEGVGDHTKGDHTARLVLLGPDGTLVEDSNQGDGSDDDEAGSAQIEWKTLQETGTYTLIAATPEYPYADTYNSEQEAETATFEYQLRFYESAGSSEEISLGTNITREIEESDSYQDWTSGYYDTYEFNGTDGQVVSFEMRPEGVGDHTKGDHTARLILLGPDGSLVEDSNQGDGSDDDEAGSAQIEWKTLEETGTYTLIAATPEYPYADAYDSEQETKTATFEYQLRFYESAGPSEEISLGTNITREIEESDNYQDWTSGYYDTYEFNGTDGQVVSFEMRPEGVGDHTADNHTARLMLLGPDGALVEDSNQGDGSDDDEAGSAQIEWRTLQETGTYTLIAATPEYPYADAYDSEQETKTATFEYQLRFYESAGPSEEISLGTNIAREIEQSDNYQDWTSGYYDTYEFNGTDGQVVSFEMRPVAIGDSSDDHTARLILIGPDGTLVDDSNQGDGSDDDEAGSAQIERLTLDETGTYTLIAATPEYPYADTYDSEQETKTATFEYQLRFYESAGPGRLLAYGDEVDGKIDIRDNYQDSLGGYYDAYSLSAMDGDTVSVRMLVDNPDEHTAHIIVLDPSGTQIAETDTDRGRAQLESLTLGTTGVYEIVATTPEAIDTDTYDSDKEAKNDFFNYRLEVSGPVNNPPVLSAETSARTAAVGETVTLSTSAVDPNGDSIGYTWTQKLGVLPDPKVNIRNANSGTATFVAPEVDDRTELVFEVTAVDGNGGEVTDSVSVIVDPSLNGTPNQSNPESLVVDKQDPNAYDTIQAAVDAASDGDTVEVRPGTYQEQVVLNKDITLLAPNGATLDGSSLSGNTTGIRIPTDSSVSPTIEGFTIMGYTDGIDTSDTSGAWIVRDVMVRTVSGNGIDAFSSTGSWVIRNTRVTAANQTGIEAGFTTANWTIRDSRATDNNGTGINTVVSSGSWTIQNTSVINNRLVGVNAFSSDGSWTIRDTSIVDNGLSGVDAVGSTGNWKISNSTVARNGAESVLTTGIRASSTTGEWTIVDSKITNNADTAPDLNATDASPAGEASGNWWGAANGPSGDFAGSGDTIVGNVTVKPYYTDSTLTSLSDTDGTLTAEDIDITVENNFEKKTGQGVLKTLFEISEDAIPLPNTGPEEQQSYIDSNVTVEIDSASSRDVERVSLTFEARGETFGGGEVGRIPYESGDTYRAQNLRVSSPTQVKITQFKRVMTIISSLLGAPAPGTSAPLESGIRQDLEAYPDVSITSVNIEFVDGSTTQIEVDKQLPRFTDTCQDPLLSMELRTYPDPECKFPDSDQDAVMVLSPARIVVEDEQGRQTGRIRENGEYQTVSEIPGSFYSGNRSDEFVLVPDGGNYSVELIGTGEGNATIVVDDVERIDGNATVTSTEYQNITVSESTRVTTGFSNTTLTVTDDNGTRSVSPDKTERISPAFSVAEYDRDDNGQIGFTDLLFALEDYNSEEITFIQLLRVLQSYNTGETV